MTATSETGSVTNRVPMGGRLAVIRFGSVGDVILSTPALTAIRDARPDLELIYVTKAAMAPLITHHPAVNDVIRFDSREGIASLAGRLRERRPDALLDLHGNLRSRRVCSSFRGIPTVTWTKRPWRDVIPVRMGWRPYRAEMMIAERYIQAAGKLLGQELGGGLLRYIPGADDHREAHDVLSALSIDTAKPLIGVSPGARWETKRWPDERFAEVVRRALAMGAEVIVTGSEDEAEIVENVTARAPGSHALAGGISLGGLGGLVARMRVFVANDSGPMHMARGLGIPTVAVFGSTDPRQFDFSGHSLVYRDAPCAPCHFYGRRRCPRRHFRCMLEIGVDEVWSGVSSLLEGEKGAMVSG